MSSKTDAAQPSVAERREWMRKWEQMSVDTLGSPPEGLAEAWIDITLPDGWVSRTKLVWPLAASPPGGGESNVKSCPLIVFFHGGGFFLGSPDQVLLPARGFALNFGVVVACPSYKMTPENAFPAPVYSAWDACAWLSDAQNLNDGPLKGTGVAVDPKLSFIVGGLSAGGQFTAVLGGIQAAAGANPELLAGRAPMQAPITGLFTGIPATLNEAMVPERYRAMFRSREENGNPVAAGSVQGLTLEFVREAEALHQADYQSPWFSPLGLDSVANRETLKQHPPKVFLQACSLDPLRDDTVIYDKWLREVGAADTEMRMCGGLNHYAWVTMDWPGSQRKLLREVFLDGMGWLVGGEWDKSRESKY